MDREQKELEGPDFEREQRVEQSRREQHDEEQLPEVIAAEVRDIAFDHRSRLFDALALILAGEQVNVTLYYLPQREVLALEALQAAVTGSDSMGEFVFAEDRRMLLEQALAVLQQNLTHGDRSQLVELQNKFDSMTAQVGELRERLVMLEDAQEEVDEFHQKAKDRFEDSADKADPDKPKADAGLVDFIAEALFAMGEVSPTKASTLAGEERPNESPKPTSLIHGPDVKLPQKPPTSLTGPDLQEPPKPPTTLLGPEPKPEPKPPTSLTGPEIPQAPKPPSLLDGDPTPQRRVVKETPLPGPPSTPTPTPKKP